MENKKVMVYSNEHKAWWKPFYFGYTNSQKEAGIFNYDDVIKDYPYLDFDSANDDFLVDIEVLCK